MKKNNQNIYVYLAALYVGMLIVGVAIGSKLIALFGVIASLSALTYPITFLITDVVGEVYGKLAARRIVIMGFLSLVLTLVFFQIAIMIPPSDIWGNQDGFESIFGQSVRIILAGTLAYLISQLHDVWAFDFWKKATNGKHLWLRNNASTIVSQLIDTAIFVTIAFYGVAPLWQLFIGQYLLKISIAALDTPFIYLLSGYLKKRQVSQ